ncbi:CueP family metal-binding protein, partial [Georgenia sp. Z1491]|uniref:CueP family metal-binding protein n=1 Tax=Georgenia sp. Z1491 TaxID=3416707 RepID=UPI003CF50F3D
GQDIQVRILDQASGEELVNDEMTTFDNGFAGFWLPRDVEGTIEITYDGLTGTADFSTTDDGATCLTDLQLA